MTDVGASLKKVRRAGMTENMGMKPLQARGLAAFPDDPVQHGLPQTSSQSSQEQGSLMGIVQKNRPSDLNVTVESSESFSRNRKATVFSTFSRTDPKRSLLKIDVVDIEALTLAHSNTSSVISL